MRKYQRVDSKIVSKPISGCVTVPLGNLAATKSKSSKYQIYSTRLFLRPPTFYILSKGGSAQIRGNGTFCTHSSTEHINFWNMYFEPQILGGRGIVWATFFLQINTHYKIPQHKKFWLLWWLGWCELSLFEVCGCAQWTWDASVSHSWAPSSPTDAHRIPTRNQWLLKRLPFHSLQHRNHPKVFRIPSDIFFSAKSNNVTNQNSRLTFLICQFNTWGLKTIFAWQK